MPALVGLLLAAGSASAQTWSLDQIVRETSISNPAIIGKKYSATAAEAEVAAAKWQRYPTPGLTLSRDTQGKPNALLSVQQPLYAGGKIDASIDAAQVRFSAAQSAVTETQQTVLAQVITAYAEATLWQGRIDINQRMVGQLQLLLDMMNRRVAAKASPAVDQSLAQARFIQANSELLTARHSLARALTQLSQLVGKNVTAVSLMPVADVRVPGSKEVALETALTVSPILARLTFEAAVAEAEVAVQKSNLLPTVSARFENQKADLPYTAGYQRVMVVMNMQTGAGLSAISGIDAANGRRLAILQTKESAAIDLRQQVSIDWDLLVFARSQIENTIQASSISKGVFESYTRQFTAGTRSWLDLLNTVRETGQNDMAVLDGQAQILGASLRLSLWTGKLIQ